MNLKSIYIVSVLSFLQNIKLPKNKYPHSFTKCERIIVNSFISKGSEREYQLWVNSGKEEAPYPLIGKFLWKYKIGLIVF